MTRLELKTKGLPILRTARHPALAWAEYNSKIRQFFGARNFTEVSTPLLVEAGAFEHALDSLQVRFQGGQAELHTSPEIEMKALLAETPLDIFQITKCFRDDPPTGIHYLEFHMLEFYQMAVTYRETRALIRELFSTLAGRKLEFQEWSIEEALAKFAGTSLTDIEKISDVETRENLFFQLMLEKVEPALPPDIPVILYDYPASISTLAQTGANGRGERFECYWQGMELCNGATELGDASELKNRYALESQWRRAMGKAPHPFPQRLYDALQNLPPCSGVAVGLDRLFRCLS